MNRHQAGFSPAAILLVLITIIVVGASVFYVYNSQQAMEEKQSFPITTVQNNKSGSIPKINPADFKKYKGKGVSFDYPKEWTLSSQDIPELSQQRIFIKTDDYKYKGELTSIRSFRVEQGYALEVSSIKSNVFNSTQEIHDYLKREGGLPIELIKTKNGSEMVEAIGIDSAHPDYRSNSFTQAKFVQDGLEYSIIYYYPDSDEFVSDQKHINLYRHLLDTFQIKRRD